MGGGVGGTITVAEAGGKRRADDGGGRPRVPVMLPLPLAGAYDYAVPPAMEAVPGAVVTVPLGPHVLYGVVWHGPADGSVPASKLRPITSVVPTPPLRPALLRFIDWVADYTLSAPGEVTVEGKGEAGPTASGTTGVPSAGEPPAVDDLALEILRVVVDVHSFEADHAGRRFHLVKRSRST